MEMKKIGVLLLVCMTMHFCAVYDRSFFVFFLILCTTWVQDHSTNVHPTIATEWVHSADNSQKSSSVDPSPGYSRSASIEPPFLPPGSPPFSMLS